MTCPYNTPFTIPAYQPATGGFTPDQLQPQPGPAVMVHPVTRCTQQCNAIADAKYAECSAKIKQFTEYMNSQGCSGTWCTTQKKKSCPM